MSIHWSITRAADWVIRLQEEKKTDLSKEELITLFSEWADEAKKDKPKKSPEETKEARIKGAAKARENKKLKADSLSDEEKHEKKVLSQKKRAAKAKVGSDAWEKMTEDERDKLIEEDHRKESMKDKPTRRNQHLLRNLRQNLQRNLRQNLLRNLRRRRNRRRRSRRRRSRRRRSRRRRNR